MEKAGGAGTAPPVFLALLKGASSQALHLLMDVAIGAVGLLALIACLLAWRLAQGPIDITGLVKREQSLLTGPLAHLSIGGAALAWEGFVANDRPLDIRVQDVRVNAADGTMLAELPQARVSLAIGQLLLGRVVPRSVEIDGASLQLERLRNGTLRLDLGQTDVAEPQAKTPSADWIFRELSRPARQGDNLPWLSQLHRVQVHDARFSIRDQALGVVWLAPHAQADLLRLPDGGVAGQAHMDVAVGQVHASLTATAQMRGDGTHLTATTTPVSPASLANVAPQFAALSAVEAPMTAKLDATLGPGLVPLAARLEVSVAAGTLKLGRGEIGLQSASAVFSARPTELMLDSARISFTAPPGKSAPPTLTAQATATLLAGHVHATFGLAVDTLNIPDLSYYLPEGTGGGSRGWLVENLLAGRAHDAHVEGAIDAPEDFSDPQLTALTGGLSADDVSVVWLKPIPPITHGRAKLVIEGLDSIRITMDAGEQDALRLQPGSTMEITQLQGKHQFGDIDIRIGGPLDTALKLLNHPRLKLLSRSGLDFAGASGQAQAHLQVHLPLEEKVTMDDIKITSTASLSDVHLGKIAAGHDLDHAKLAIKVNNDGLGLTGHGDFSGIPTDLAVDMDFLDGPADQVLQHVTAHGTATPAQFGQSGVPAMVAHLFTEGSAALSADYTTRRNHTATLQINANLGDAVLETPLGWKKTAGPAASAAMRLGWDHGTLVDLDNLRAEGPGLHITSHARLEAEHTQALVLDRIELGRTRAHGEIIFSSPANDRLRIALSGPALDISGYLEEPQSERAKSVPGREDDTPETPPKRDTPWQADLDFNQVVLAKGKTLAPLKLSAASDGFHVVQAKVTAGAPGDLVASIEPGENTRRISVKSADAGVFLQAMGVADNIDGGALQLDGVFADTQPGDPLTGTATLNNFNLRSAPAIGRLLQAMTLYGLTDVLRGPGLHFAKLIAPYRWQRRILSLKNARAFSQSLGLTAQGDIDLRRRVADVKGTVVPAYFFNQLLGNLPLVGRVFSPEKGGGVFAARYSVTGPLSDPKVGVNPLSALTPGFLREGFGLLSPGK